MVDTGGRAPNPRGQGPRLRREVLEATAALLARDRAGPSVTLRAIAREAGVAAPSIYAHFPHRDAILEEVVREAFSELGGAVSAAAATDEPPPDRLVAVCQAYLAFAHAHAGRYRVMFGRSGDALTADPRPYGEGIEAFAVLEAVLGECVAGGHSTSTDPRADSVAVWTYLHGLVLLPAATPGFPWPALARLVDPAVRALAHLSTTSTVT